MDMSPYALRLELLKLAQSILEQDFYNKKEQAIMKYDSLKEYASDKGLEPPELPCFPKPPTSLDVIAQADLLNGFVSRRT